MALILDSRGEPIKQRRPGFDEVSGLLTSSGKWQDLVADWSGELLSFRDDILREEGGGGYWAYDLYDRVLMDDQVFACLQQRFGMDVEMEVVPGDDSRFAKRVAREFREEWLSLAWGEVVQQMKAGFLYGKSVAEVLWRRDGRRVRLADIRVRDRRRFRFGKDGSLRLLTQWDTVAGRDVGKDYPFQFWVFRWGGTHHDMPDGLGLGHWLYWPVTFKRQGVKFWMYALERAGTSLPVLYYPAGTGAEERQALRNILAKLRQNQALLLPDGTRVEFPQTNGGIDSYGALVQWCDEAISKIILTNTMTVESGSSRSQAEVHERAAGSVTDADNDLLCESFNRQVARWWTWLNYGDDAPAPQVWRKISKGTPADQLAIDRQLFDLGFPPTPEHVAEHYGMGYQMVGRQLTDGQVSAMLQILMAGGRGDLPMGTVKEALRVTLPSLTAAEVEALVKPLHKEDKRGVPPDINALIRGEETTINTEVNDDGKDDGAMVDQPAGIISGESAKAPV